MEHSILSTCATDNPAASLRCLNCRLVNKTQYTQHLRDGEACSHLTHGESCDLPEVREVQINQTNCIFATCASGTPATSLRCVKCRLVDKTQYIQHLTLGESCALPEVR